MLVHVGVDDYWWHAVKTRRAPLISAAGDRCTSSVWTASRSSTAGGHFRLAFTSGPLAPEGGLDSCERGAEWVSTGWTDRGDFPPRGHRTTRAWNQHGVEGSAERLIKLAWEMDLAKGYEEQCPFASFGLLLRSTRIVEWKPTVVATFLVARLTSQTRKLWCRGRP